MSATKTVSNNYLDRAAIWLSGLCLLHCFAVPIALVMGSAFSERLEATETTVHWVLFGIAIPISAIALFRGYRHLGGFHNLLLGGIGLLLMLLAVSHVLGREFEVVLTVIGVSSVLVAHLRNLTGHRALHHKN